MNILTPCIKHLRKDEYSIDKFSSQYYPKNNIVDVVNGPLCHTIVIDNIHWKNIKI